jgi:hypothetical protein
VVVICPKPGPIVISAIERIEELRPELKALPPGHVELSRETEIHGHRVRPPQNAHAGISECLVRYETDRPGRGLQLHERVRIED